MEYIHQKVVTANHTDICGMWKFKDIVVKAYVPADETGLFEVILMARQHGWEIAKFKVILSLPF